MIDPPVDPRIKMRHINVFLETVRQRSVVRAAAALNVTQPAASKTIKELETIVGVKLFERGGRTLLLSPMGEVFYAFAERGIANFGRGLQAVSNLRDYPLVRIGALPTASARILPGAMTEVATMNLPLRVQIVTGPNSYLLGLLRAGEADLVLGRMAEPDEIVGLSFEHLYSEPLAVIVRPGHPLLETPDAAAGLSAFPLLLPPPGAAIRRPVERLLAQLGVDIPPFAIESVSDAFARNYVRDSDTIWFISEGVARRDVRDGILALLPLELGDTTGPIGLTTRTATPLSTSGQLLVGAIRSASAPWTPP